MKIKWINARIVDANQDFVGTVCTDNGIISYVGTASINGEYDHIIDAAGKTLMPAFIDLHAHLRTPGYSYKEDFHTGFAAALKGGYATVCGMANTLPVMDTAQAIKANINQANAMRLINYIQIASLGMDLSDQTCVDFASIRKHTSIFSNDGNTIFSDSFMSECLLASAKHDFILATHCQPEEEIVNRDLGLLKKVGGNLHICHISVKETMDRVVKAKNEGLKLTCEVTPHHLFAYDLDYKVNPAIAGKKDVQALLQGIRDGYIDVLATDHAPHTAEDKKNGSPGIDNIEYAFQIYLKVFMDNGISLCKLSEMIADKPARMLKLNKGLIKPGYEADIVLIDTEPIEKIDPSRFVSKSSNTPFEGWEVKGKVLKTIVNGEIRYDSEQTL